MAERKGPKQQARDRIRLLDDPAQASKVLSHDRYWTRCFLELYLERCDDVAFGDPAAGLLYAEVAPLLVQRIPVGPRPGDFRLNREKASWMVRALCVHGSAAQRANRFTDAGELFRRAFRLRAEAKGLDAVAHAELCSRYGNFLVVTGGSDAEAWLDEALDDWAPRHRDRAVSAEALLARGRFHFSQNRFDTAARDLVEAIELVADASKRDRGRRSLEAAVMNVPLVIEHLDMFEASKQASVIKRILQSLSKRSEPVLKARLNWIEGRLYHRVHLFAYAERRLERARRTFRGVGLYFEFALVSLDIARIRLEYEGGRGLDELRSHTLEALAVAEVDPALPTLLQGWEAKMNSDDLQRLAQAVAVDSRSFSRSA